MSSADIRNKKPDGNGFPELSTASDSGSLDGVGYGADVLMRHIRDDSRDIAHSASEHAQHQYADVKAYAQRSLRSLEHEVAVKPVQSVAIAMATGALLSFLFARR